MCARDLRRHHRILHSVQCQDVHRSGEALPQNGRVLPCKLVVVLRSDSTPGQQGEYRSMGLLTSG